ncbi:MAG: phosphoglucosamine mutase, partial [Aeromonadaceae bacterium]
MSRKYFGTDGVRGLVGQSPITPDFVMRLGWAAGKVLARQGTRKVLIGKDTRISGYMLESAMEAGLSAAGIQAVLLGPMPTPAVAYLTRAFRAEAGVVISASHNPYYDNGIKFFSQDGTKLPDDVELEIERQLDMPFECVESAKLGKATRIDDAPGRYIEYCKSAFPGELSLDGLKIVLDCAHGATYHIAPSVFRELGAEVVVIGCAPNGLNINDQVGSTHPDALMRRVCEESADLGIAFDGDGDRVMMVDGEGNLIDGDEILFMIACDQQSRGKLVGGVVGTQMTNLAMELALQSLGIPFARANVGDRYVMEMLKELGWRLGGENSGHVICLDHATTGDGIVASLQVLQAMVRAQTGLASLRGNLRLFPQRLVNVRFAGGVDPLQQP